MIPIAQDTVTDVLSFFMNYTNIYTDFINFPM